MQKYKIIKFKEAYEMWVNWQYETSNVNERQKRKIVNKITCKKPRHVQERHEFQEITRNKK